MDASLLRRSHVSALDDPARAPAIGTRRPGGAPTWVVALVALAVAGGVALRFLTRSQLWLDEALSVNIAKVPLGQLPNALRHDGSPPLYYLLLHWWIAVVGAGDVAVRALSAAFAVGEGSFSAFADSWASAPWQAARTTMPNHRETALIDITPWRVPRRTPR